jgi:hypothetical protein
MRAKPFDYVGHVLLAIMVAISIFSYMSVSDESGKITMYDIWYYGWVTAISTALGVIPFFFVKSPDRYWMGVSNGDNFFISNSLYHIMMVIFSYCGGNDDCILI